MSNPRREMFRSMMQTLPARVERLEQSMGAVEMFCPKISVVVADYDLRLKALEGKQAGELTPEQEACVHKVAISWITPGGVSKLATAAEWQEDVRDAVKMGVVVDSPYTFHFCPECGAPIDWPAIQAELEAKRKEAEPASE